ncbi:hypothetical protein D3C78_819900 [compost metagenome]
MGGEKRLDPRRVRFAGRRGRGHRQHLLIEGFRGVHRQYRWGVHAGAPDLAVVAAQLQRQAAGRHAGIGAVRVAATNRETADHRHPLLAEHPRPGQRCGLVTAEEVATDAQALGVIFTVAGVVPGLGFEGVDDAFRGQAFAADPAGGIGKTCGQGAQAETDCSQAQGAGTTV